MQSLRVKVEIILFFVVMLVVALSYGIQRLVILPSLNPFSEEAAKSEMKRGLEAIQAEESRLEALARNLTADPAMAAFAADPTSSAIASQLGASQLVAQNINFVFIVRADGTVAYSRAIFSGSQDAVRFPEFPEGGWLASHPLLTRGTGQALSGGFITYIDPALVAARAIEDPSGAHAGTLVVGRLLDRQFLSQVYRQTHVSFTVWRITDPRVTDEREKLAAMIAGDRYYVDHKTDELFYVSTTYPGVNDNPVLLLQSETQQTVLARAYEALQNGLLAQVGIGLAALVALIMLFRRIVMNPLSRLTQHTIALKQSNNLSTRLALQREDEIGVLANEFDRLVEQLEEDIRAQRRAEEALRASEERYALAVRGANDGLWDWDLSTNEIHFSHRWKSMLGFEEHEIGNNPEEWLRRIHPDDIENVKAALDAHLKGQTGHFETEHRIRHKDESFLWVLCRGLAIRNEQGQATRMAGSQSDITPRKIIEEQLSHQALHDSLTTLPNRALFMDRLGQAMKHAKRNKDYQFAVFFLDVDRFKVINDGLGHVMGDGLLSSIAQKLGVTLRESDTISRHGGTVARFGGDEFVLLVDNLRDINDATLVAQRIQEIFREPFQIEGNEIFTSVSIGIALSATMYKNQDELLRSADTAMYRAKALGKARFEVFDTDMREKAMARLQLENDLRRAIDREEFCVFYQPIVNLGTGRIEAFEALVRWNHPDRGLLSPVEFIPVAEETGMIVPIGQMVFRQACKQARTWQIKLPRERSLVISVNLSVKDFSQPGLVESVERTLIDTGLEPQFLKLEITESAIMESVDFAIKILKRIREMNVQLAIDDFGTGYSSLSYLNRFPMNTLKIDRAFVRDMDTTRESLQIVKTVVLLAQALEMTVIAEGIETDEQLRVLRELHCEYGQGYYFSPPLEAEAAYKLLAAERVW
ncbi:MAG: EAL domain-containing protein [Candidatus Hydrogenedentes bacterium]|nr:EAL domain-containing protein [Candidatus Hydrogenedentota bacterium]